MRVQVSGVGLHVEPAAELHVDEWRLLERLAAQDTNGAGPAVEFALDLVERIDGALQQPPEGAPAAVRVRDGRVLLSQHRFAAEIDPEGCRGRLARENGSASGLAVTLRVAAACLLPGSGALPVHGAAAVVAGRGAVFVGASGAGKSTLAGTSPWPLLSDEQVVLRLAHEWQVEASPLFPGQGSVPGAPVPLRAVFDLEKAAGLQVDRLSPAQAVRRLARVVLVPAHPAVWSATLRMLCRLVESVPVYRLAWAREQPPWREIEALLGVPLQEGSSL